MNAHEIEPVLFLGAWLEELDLSISKSSEKSLVPYVTHTIQRQFSLAFLQQYGLYEYIIRFRGPPIIVD